MFQCIIRYEKGGEALLLLLPSEEEAMIQHLGDKKIPIENIRYRLFVSIKHTGA